MRKLAFVLFFWTTISVVTVGRAEIVLLDVPRGHAFDEAGLQTGDRLVSYVVQADDETYRGKFDSVFDVYRIATKLAPQGRAMLECSRDGETMTVPVPVGYWTGEVAPAGDFLQRYREAQTLLQSDDERASGLTLLLEMAGESSDPLAAAWYRHIAGKALRQGGDTELGDEQTELAKKLALSAGDAYAAGWLLQDAAIQYAGLGRPQESQPLFERALVHWQQDESTSLAVAVGLNNLGILASIRGDHAAASEFAQRALAIRKRLTGDSVYTADSVHTLGNAAFWSDRMDEAESYYREALAIRRAAAPGSEHVARNLAVLSNIHWRHGELARAQELTEEALAIFRELEANPVFIGESLVMLGHYAHDRGNYEAAETYRLQALELFELSNPQATQVPDTLLGLGNVARRRGDRVAAGAYFDRALALYEQLQPGGQRVAMITQSLGLMALEHGDLKVADEKIRDSLRVMQELGGDGPQVASRHQALAKVAIARDDFVSAREYLSLALDGFSNRTAHNLQVAGVQRDIAKVAVAEQRIEDAQQALLAALEISTELAPDTLHEALPAHQLAVLLEEAGDPQAALLNYRRAVDALEGQRTKLGGTDRARTSFEERYGHLYRDYLRLLLELERNTEAFNILERYRARAMLAEMEERRVEIPATQDVELVSRLGRANWKYEQALQNLAETSQPTPAQSDELATLRSEREELVGRVRATTPRHAAAIAPEPLSLDEVAKVVPAGTAVLSYAVLDEELVIFAVPTEVASRATGLAVIRVPVAREALQAKIRRLRHLLQVPDAGDTARSALDELGRELYELLLAPVEGTIADADNLLVLPDGPLHLLPFGMLEDAESGEYLVERWPFRLALSLTHADRQRGTEKQDQSLAIVAVGAPAAALEETSSAAERQAEDALPAALQELEMIGERFSDAVVYTGQHANEESVRRLPPEMKILHFATHAVTNPDSPLDSHLVLSQVAGSADDGRLHAWEIYEQLSIDTELVVLSACETGFGRTRGGDGLVSLTRAFQQAGARSVLATLWPVADKATAELMERFYSDLRGGATAEDALRSAQLALIRESRWRSLRKFLSGDRTDYSHPYYWSGFQLHGQSR